MSKARKIMPIILTAVVIIMPLFSWYYLNSGLEYRKELERETIPISDFEQEAIFQYLLAANPDIEDLFIDKTTVLVNADHPSANQAVAVYDQYKNAISFQMISVGKEKIAPDQNFEHLELEALKLMEQEICLIDTSLNLIRNYELNHESLNKLVHHIAVVLPRVAERDINVKANQ